MRRFSSASLVLGLTAFSAIAGLQDLHGAVRTRSATAGALNVTNSWGGGIPGINDYAKWDTTSVLDGALGASTNWTGIELGAPSGTVTISAAAGHTLTLGLGGIKMPTGSKDLGISAPLILRTLVGQVWTVDAGRTLTLSGAFTRSLATTLNVQGTGNVYFNNTGLANDATGIVGPWFTYGSGANTTYASLDGSNKVIAYASQDVALNGLTSATGNYETDDLGALASGAIANTLRYKGAAGTISGDLTVNGILNSGTGTLALSGNITIGNQRELVLTVPDATRHLELKGVISDNQAGASSVLVAHNTSNTGSVVFHGSNTYTGVTYVQSGILEIRHDEALGSTIAGTTIYTANRASIRLSGGISVAEELTFTGGDLQGTSAVNLMNSSGINTLTGRIILDDNIRIGGNSGANNILNIEGGIDSVNNGSRQLVINPNGSVVNFRLNSVNLGSGGTLYFDQAGTVNLEVGGNTWGKTLVSNGTMRLHAENVLPSTASIQMGAAYGGATGVLDLNGYSQSTGRIEQAHPTPGMITSTSGAATLTTDQGSTDTTYTGSFQGNLSLNKKGSGTLNLAASNTNTGEVVITAGKINLVKVAQSTGTIQTATTTANVVMTSVAGLQVGQVVTGTNVTANTWISAINMATNTISLSRAPSASISGSLTFGALSGDLKGSTLNYNNQGGQLTFGSFANSAELGGIKGSQNLALTNLSSGAVALSVGFNGNSTQYAGVFSGAGSLTKEGTGVLTLSNAHTFTGGTTVKAGALLVQHNGVGSALGTGSVTTLADSGAILGGSGSITGGSAQNITLNQGTFLQIGQTHGVSGTAQKLQLGATTATSVNLTLAGTLQFDLFSSLAGMPEAEADLLKLSSIGTVALNGGVVSVAALGDISAWAIGDTWRLIDWTGTTRTGALTLGAMPTVAGTSWTSFTDANGFYVQLAAVPEPTQAALLIGGVLALGLRRRRSESL